MFSLYVTYNEHAGRTHGWYGDLDIARDAAIKIADEQKATVEICGLGRIIEVIEPEKEKA